MTPFGLYIHIPFCEKKCPYCDFYSKKPSLGDTELYVPEVKKRIEHYSEIYSGRSIDTVYFGGGTPSLIGADALNELLSSVMENFPVTASAEVTVEANPGSVNRDFFEKIRKGGFNRLSLGLQSANADELAFLGRPHSAEDVKDAVEDAKKAGFDNISLDLMTGLPGQTEDKLSKSIAFCSSLGVSHVSSYILKIEEGTVFHRKAGKGELLLPDDDRVSDLYLHCVKKLSECGFSQYEISNFSKPGFEGKHNLHYWHDEEYLGIGPAAHSFMKNERFFFGRSLKDFLNGASPVPDGRGGDISEKIMLGLRLTEGLTGEALSAYENGPSVFAELMKKAASLPKQLVNTSGGRISLTPEGFLVSNTIINLLTDVL